MPALHVTYPSSNLVLHMGPCALPRMDPEHRAYIYIIYIIVTYNIYYSHTIP